MPSRFARSLERELREDMRQEEHARRAIKPRRKPGNRAMARTALGLILAVLSSTLCKICSRPEDTVCSYFVEGLIEGRPPLSSSGY